MKRYFFLRTLACFLAFLLSFEQVPVQSLAVDNALIPSSVEDPVSLEVSETNEPSNVLYEIESRREESSKHYRNKDGSHTAVTYGFPVHEIDENGVYQEIDNTLLEERAKDGTRNYVQTSLRKKTTFYERIAGKPTFTVEMDDTSFSWGLHTVNSEIKRTLTSAEAEKGMEAFSTKAVSGRLTYEEVYPGIDAEYSLISHEIKENIVLKTREAAESHSEGFTFLLQTKGLSAGLTDDRTVELTDKTGKIVTTITAPYMEDAEGMLCTGLTMTLTETEPNGYMVTLIPDADWLLSEERAFPVVIDPSMAIAYSGYRTLQNVTVFSGNPNTNYYGYGELYVGRSLSLLDMRSVFRINELPNLYENEMVVRSTISFKVKFYSQKSNAHAGTTVMNLFPMTSNVALNTLTWNNITGTYGDSVIDTARIEPDEAANIKPRVTWDITKAVKHWYNTGTNYGLALVSENESPSSIRYLMLYSATTSSSVNSNSPIFSIDYLSEEGIVDFLSYHSSGSGSMGNVYVGDFNGNLLYVYGDLSMTGAYLPIEIYHVYDHCRKNRIATGSIIGNGMNYGRGFRLNLSERIIDQSGSNVNYPYQYIDDNSAVHYFTLKTGTLNQTNSTYEKEFDQSTIITKTSSGYTLNDGGTVTKVFNADGYLTVIRDDSTGREQTLEYDLNGRLVAVKDGSGTTDATRRIATLSYDGNGYLTSITDPAERSTLYSYINGNLTSISRQVDYDDSTGIYSYETVTLDYTYMGDGYHLMSVNAPDGSALAVTYDDHLPYRVKEVLEYGTDGTTEGERLRWTYTTGETTIEDRQGRSETMFFDDVGHTVVIRDNQGYAVFGGYAGTNDDGKHALLYQSKLHGTVRNLASNHEFEAGTLSPWTIYGDSTGGTVSLNANLAREGNKSTLLVLSDPLKTIGIEETVDLSTEVSALADRSYTLSAYLYFDSTSANDNGNVRLGLSYQTAADVFTTIESGDLKKKEGWNRYVHTFTVPSDAYGTVLRPAVFLKDATTSCYVDSVQFEEGVVSNRYNLLENGSFLDALNSVTASGWTGINLSSSDSVTAGRSGNGFTVSGEALTEKGLSQTISVKNGHTGDQYVFGGWEKAEAVPVTGLFKNDERNFGIRIRFIKSDSTYEEVFKRFEAKTPNYQYLSGSAIAPTDYVSIRFDFLYQNEKNPVCFDDAELYREGFGMRYEYDSDGRVTKSIDPTGQETTYTYLQTHRPEVSRIDYPDGTYATFTYDPTTRRLLSSTDSSGVTTTYGYDSNGNPTGSSVSHINSTLTMPSAETAYTGNYVSGIEDARGNVTAYYYDQTKGTLNSVTDPLNITATYSYQSYTDALLGISKAGSTASISYDIHGRQTGLSHNTTSSSSGDVSYSFTYDVFGNRTETKVGSATLATYEYFPNNGELKKTRFAGGDNSVENVYDDLGRIVKVRYNNNDSFVYHYGADGRVGWEEDLENRKETRYEYDGNGRMTSSVGSDSHAVSIGYDSVTGEVTETETESDDGVNRTTYQYSGHMGTGGTRVLTSIGFAGADTMNGTDTPMTLTYTYDAFYGKQGYQVTPTTGTSLSVGYTYTAGTGTNTTTSLIESHTETYGSTTVSRLYSYDERGNIESVSDGTQTILTYEYDDLNELLIARDLLNDRTFVYTYDLGGNLLSETVYHYTAGSLNGLTPIATHTYTYGNSDWKDQLTAYDGNTITYVEPGNTLRDYKGRQMVFLKGRNLTHMVYHGDMIQFYHDSEGLYGRTTLWQQPEGGGTKLFVRNGRILEETKDSKIVRYQYDENGFPVGFKMDGHEYLYLKTIQGDVTGIIDIATGVLEVEYAYDPWGMVLSVTGDTTLAEMNSLLYRGYYYDWYTELYYCGSRFYDPVIKRWISPDGLLSTGQGTLSCNMYAYCLNNPVNGVDRNGDQCVLLRNDDFAVYACGGLMIFGACYYSSLPKSQHENLGEIALSIVTGGVYSVAKRILESKKEKIADSNKKKGKEQKKTSAGKMQKQIEKGQAPNTVIHADSGSENSKGLHEQVHFRDGTVLNSDGTYSHKFKGIHNLTNKEAEWLLENGWEIPK